MPIPTDEERIGSRLAGRYTLTGILGRGGMGVVYDGHHTFTGRRVAIKLLPPALAHDPQRKARMMREARAAAALAHPHIVDVLDMGEDESGCLYLVLEHLEGPDLASLLETAAPLEPPEALALLLPILDALQAAHEAGIVHRDVKPANILLARKGEARVPTLLDFGLARPLNEAPLTTTGSVIGTPHYMSPEAAAGEAEPGPESDVWSAGVVLYEALSGKRPFEAPAATAILMKVLQEDAPPLELPGAPHIADAVRRALARGDERIRSARELSDALCTRSDAAEPGRDARRNADDPTRSRTGRRHIALAALLLSALAAATGLFAMTAEKDAGDGARHAPTPSAARDPEGATMPLSATPPPDAESATAPASAAPSPALPQGAPMAHAVVKTTSPANTEREWPRSPPTRSARSVPAKRDNPGRGSRGRSKTSRRSIMRRIVDEAEETSVSAEETTPETTETASGRSEDQRATTEASSSDASSHPDSGESSRPALRRRW